MVKKNNLVKLIKSLSKTEKRYIQIRLSYDKSSSNYPLLFNYIDKTSNPTDQSIKAKFQNKTFTKQLHVTKNFLIKIILKHLNNFHQKSNQHCKLLNEIIDIELLIKKEQFDLAESYVESVIRNSHKFHDHTILYTALNLKKKLIQETVGPQEGKNTLNLIIDQQNQILEQLQNINQYHSLNCNFFDFFKPGSQFSKKNYTELTKNQLIQHPDSATTVESKIHYYYLQFQLSTYQDQNFDQAAKHLNQILSLLEKEKTFLHENIGIYINIANQLVNLFLYTKNYLVIPSLLEKIRNLPANFDLKTSDSDTLKGLLQSYLYELELYKSTGQTKLALDLIKSSEQFIEKHNYPITRSFLPQFYFLFAYFNFYHQNYLKATIYLKKLFSLSKIKNELTHEKILGHFLEILLNYEQKQRINLKKSLHHCTNTIKQVRRLKLEEKILLNLFEALGSQKLPAANLVNRFAEFIKTNFNQVQPELLSDLNINKWLEQKGATIL